MNSSKARGEKEPETYPLEGTKSRYHHPTNATIDTAPALVFS
jgi:hypothetical protein